MPNKTDTLIHYKSTWKHGKTTVLRIPIADKDTITKYARYIDNEGIEYDKMLLCVNYILSIKDKLNKEKGYQSKNSGRMIREIEEIINQLI